jgi:flagellar hook-associated protein 2
VNEIAAAINSAAGNVVVANVVNTGTATAPSYQIVLASKQSGEEFRLTGLTNSIAGLTIDTTGPDGNGVAQSQNNITVGNNAIALVDGLQVERTDNDFSDVVVGVSIDVLSANAGQQMTFTVEPDREAIKGRITELADAYNAVVDFVNEQSAYSEEEGAGGELFGDPILQRVRSEIQRALFDVDLGTVRRHRATDASLVGIHQTATVRHDRYGDSTRR